MTPDKRSRLEKVRIFELGTMGIRVGGLGRPRYRTDMFTKKGRWFRRD